MRLLRRAVPLLVVVLAACGGSSHPAATSSSSTVGDSTTVATAPAATAPAVPISLTDADNGRTVTVHTGERLRLALASSYWTISTKSGPVLRLDAPPSYPRDTSGCVPGEGCGGVVASFTAVAPGTATISASRTTCGEAMRCGPGQTTYRVTVKVS